LILLTSNVRLSHGSEHKDDIIYGTTQTEINN